MEPEPKKPEAPPNTDAWRAGIAVETQRFIPSVLNRFSKTAPKNAYSIKFEEQKPLDAQNPQKQYPNLATKVNVVFKDTFDAAIALNESREEMGDKDQNKVLVLNFANAFRPGGGWLNGRKAQEEVLCYRSTLSAALPIRFYPIEVGECIYSPSVFIFRDNDEKGYPFPSAGNNLEFTPEVSVISIAATNKPPLNAEETGYRDQKEEDMMRDYVRLILRVAGENHHRRLVLGAFGCGVFKHPPKKVAEIFHDILTKDPEFGGWFERITFAVLDKDRQGPNFTAFKKLNNLSMNYGLM